MGKSFTSCAILLSPRSFMSRFLGSCRMRVNAMKRALLTGAILVTAAWIFGAERAQASDSSRPQAIRTVGQHHPTAHVARRKPRKAVRSYVARRGGYSYHSSDSVNTYGDSRSLYGGTAAFRDWRFDRQSNSGPFDHGFFFDSGTRPRGGDSPYLN